jgi:hypothetical protein
MAYSDPGGHVSRLEMASEGLIGAIDPHLPSRDGKRCVKDNVTIEILEHLTDTDAAAIERPLPQLSSAALDRV